MTGIALNLDGWPLRHRRTGLGNVAANLIRCWIEQGRGRGVRVLAPAGVDPSAWGLEREAVSWVSLPEPTAATDYIARWQWSRTLTRELVRHRDGRRLFVPYLYNHFGRLRDSVVLVPDLVYRTIPFADFARRPWWDVRGRFYVRRAVMRFEEKLVQRARGWVVYSEFVGEDATTRLGIHRSRVSVSTLGPGPVFAAGGASPAELGVAGLEAPYVLYVGGYGFRKNVPLLVAACRAAAEREPAFRCVLAGVSPERFRSDPQFGLETELPAGIVCIDEVDDAQLAALYRGSRFTVFPSLAEGFGLPVVEAAACGRCTLTADNTSLRELQSDPAMRLPDRDVNAWTEAMLHLWHDAGARRAAEARLPALLAARSNARFAEDVWAAVERAFA